MEFVHWCAFCGSNRSATSAVMIPASCAGCGCALDAVARDEFDRREREHEEEPERATPKFVRLLVVAFAVVLLAAAARFGYATGGPMIAMVSVGVAGYLLLPFLPERLRPGGGAR